MENEISENKKSKRLKEGLQWSYPVVGFAAVSILLVAYLCQFAQIVSIQYTLLELRGERKVLQREQDELELSIQELTSLERVENVAVTQLGMVAPSNREVLQVVPTAAAVEVRQLAANTIAEGAQP